MSVYSVIMTIWPKIPLRVRDYRLVLSKPWTAAYSFAAKTLRLMRLDFTIVYCRMFSDSSLSCRTITKRNWDYRSALYAKIALENTAISTESLSNFTSFIIESPFFFTIFVTSFSRLATDWSGFVYSEQMPNPNVELRRQITAMYSTLACRDI